MQTIEKFIISQTEPPQTNVVWIDSSDNTPIFKTFVSGAWRTIELNILTPELMSDILNYVKNNVEYITKAGLPLSIEWDNSSIQDLAHDIFNDSNAVVGSRYTCLFSGDGLPDGMENGELEILVECGIDDIKIILMSVTSIDLAPYSWFGTYDGINWSGWRTSLIPVKTQNPQDGFMPNVMYKLGTLVNETTFTLNTTGLDNNIVNEYMWSFDTLGCVVAPTINFNIGANVVWKDGDAPDVDINKYYEISIIDNIAVCLEVDLV